MLIEIFTDTIFDETICDPSRGIESKKVPKTIISEKGDLKLRDMYLAARDFLISALDRPQYGINKGCHYMLEIEYMLQNDIKTISVSCQRSLDEKNFLFKFSSLTSHDEPYNTTVHGEVDVDEDLNVVEFKREKIYVIDYNSTTTTTNILHNNKSYCEVSDSIKGECASPFVDSCQQEVPTDSSEGADSITDECPVELSRNSFSVENGTIDVSDPNLGIGSVEGSSFSVDLDKQNKHDEFFKNMSDKISRRNRRHRI